MPNIPTDDLRRGFRVERAAPLLFLAMLIVGAFGSYSLVNRWTDVAFNHIWGLGVVGMLASLSGYIGKKKGRSFTKALAVGTALPYALGALVVVVVYFRSGLVYCGGGVVLLSAILIVIGHACLRKSPVISP